MTLTMLKSKIHRAVVTEANLNYVGSITIDLSLMKAAGILEYEKERIVVALNIGTMDSGEVAEILSDDYGIAVRSGAHCAPRMHEALGTVAQGAVRFSFGWFNTMEEAERAADAVREIAL